MWAEEEEDRKGGAKKKERGETKTPAFDNVDEDGRKCEIGIDRGILDEGREAGRRGAACRATRKARA